MLCDTQRKRTPGPLHAPKNSWDWREHARAYGPFPSQDAAVKHLQSNHANPGG
jgi:hypothetical protein